MSELPFSNLLADAIANALVPARRVALPVHSIPAPGALLGMPLHSVTEAEALAILEQRLARRQGTWVLTPNLDILRQYCSNPSVRGFFHPAAEATAGKIPGGADLLLADGMPLIWASRLAGRPLPERVPGSGLVLSLAQRAAKKGWSIFLLGGAPGAADGAADVLAKRFPGIKIAGTCCPPAGFEKDPAQLAAIRHTLVAARPDIVYVALGFPKQEFVTQYLRPYLPEATFLGIGISLSFIAGEVRRAPRWVQRAGLEWVHRLVQEPRRLAKRYLLQDAPFALFHLFPRALAARFGFRHQMRIPANPPIASSFDAVPAPAASPTSAPGSTQPRYSPDIRMRGRSPSIDLPNSSALVLRTRRPPNPQESGAKKCGERGHPRRTLQNG